MKVIDLNLLLYSVNSDSIQHQAAHHWLEDSLNADEPIALPWVVILGFLRIATHPRIFSNPLDADVAMSFVDQWLACSTVRVLHPGNEHWRIFKQLLTRSGTAGNLTTDVHIAALAIEHGAQLYSTDADFARFKQLSWVNPIAD